jgi:hypothetical protein
MTPLTLPALIDWLRHHWLGLLLGATFGLLSALVWFRLDPPRYEASFTLRMPLSNAVNQNNQILNKEIRFVPAPLEIKKLFLRPQAFSIQILEECGFKDTSEDRKRLVRAIHAEMTEYGSSAIVAVRLPGSERVRRCAYALQAAAIQFANSEKNRWVLYFQQFNQSSIPILSEDASLPHEIMVSATAVSPNVWRRVIGLILLGIFASAWAMITVGQIKRRMTAIR